MRDWIPGINFRVPHQKRSAMSSTTLTIMPFVNFATRQRSHVVVHACVRQTWVKTKLAKVLHKISCHVSKRCLTFCTLFSIRSDVLSHYQSITHQNARAHSRTQHQSHAQDSVEMQCRFKYITIRRTLQIFSPCATPCRSWYRLAANHSLQKVMTPSCVSHVHIYHLTFTYPYHQCVSKYSHTLICKHYRAVYDSKPDT